MTTGMDMISALRNTRENPLSTLLLLLATLFFLCLVLMYWYYWGNFYSDLESSTKMDFLLHFNSYASFLPGNHDKIAFYGHPGLHQFLLYFVTSLFGKTAVVVKLMGLSFAILAATAIYSITKHYHKSRLLGIMMAQLFLSYPALMHESYQFYQDIPALAFSLWGYLFYLENRAVRSGIIFTVACLILESQIAFPIAIISVHLYRRSKAKFYYPYLLPVLTLGLFFVAEHTLTGSFSNSPLLFNRGGSDKFWFFQSLEMILMGMKTFYHEYRVYLAIIAFSFPFVFVKTFRDKFVESVEPVLFITVAQFIVFFMFINECLGARDLYIVNIFLLFLIVGFANSIDSKRRLFIALYILIGGHHIYGSTGRSMHFELTADRAQLLSQLQSSIEKREGENIFYCYDLQSYLAHPHYGIARRVSDCAEDIENVNIYVDYYDLIAHPTPRSYLKKREFTDEDLTLLNFKVVDEKSITTNYGKKMSYKIYLKR